MGTIEANHYQETRDRLKADPIVQEMAAEVKTQFDRGQELEFCHQNGNPNSWFMSAANRQYVKRGKDTGPRHIGAVAEAILEIIRG